MYQVEYRVESLKRSTDPSQLVMEGRQDTDKVWALYSPK